MNGRQYTGRLQNGFAYFRTCEGSYVYQLQPSGELRLVRERLDGSGLDCWHVELVGGPLCGEVVIYAQSIHGPPETEHTFSGRLGSAMYAAEIGNCFRWWVV